MILNIKKIHKSNLQLRGLGSHAGDHIAGCMSAPVRLFYAEVSLTITVPYFRWFG